MSLWRVGFWGGRGGTRNVYPYSDGYRHRLGDCEFLPRDGDLCIRTGDAGDFCHSYVAVRRRDDGKYVAAGKFGAYTFGEPLCTLDERTFHLACAGEPIDLPPTLMEWKYHSEAAVSRGER